MLIPIDEVVYFDVCTHDPTSGGVSDADSTPTFSVMEESTDTPILADQNFTKRTSLTGNYRGSFTASTANGFEAGKWYSVIATAVVGGVTGKKVAVSFRAAPAEASAGVPMVQTSAISANAITATAIAADAITAAKIADGAIDAATFAAGAINAAAIAADAITDAKVAADVTIASVTGAVGSVTGNVGGNVTGSVGSLGAQAKLDVNAEVDTAISDAALATAANLATVAGYIDTEVAAIKAKTDNLPASPAATGDIPSAATIASAVLTAADSAPIASNVKEVNDVGLTGDGTIGTPWGPA
jgi:hypothetical protein